MFTTVLSFIFFLSFAFFVFIKKGRSPSPLANRPSAARPRAESRSYRPTDPLPNLSLSLWRVDPTWPTEASSRPPPSSLSFPRRRCRESESPRRFFPFWRCPLLHAFAPIKPETLLSRSPHKSLSPEPPVAINRSPEPEIAAAAPELALLESDIPSRRR